MDAIVYFFLACVGGLTIATNDEISTPTRHLDRRLREAKVDIAKAYSEEPQPVAVVTKSYDVQWGGLWSEPLDTSNALAVNLFDETFILANNRVIRLEMDPRTNRTLRQAALIQQEYTVKFVRNIVWKGTLYLLIGQEGGSCSLYTANSMNDLDLRHRQTVRHQGLPMDAAFFTQANQLYLVVADNTGQFSVPSVIYHWTGTYMDVIAEVMTTGAVSVTTFNHKHSVIIVFAQNVQGNSRIGSEVYKFKHTSIERIQFLGTVAPVSIHHYRHDHKTFLLVINEMEPCNVFWWDGKEFLNWMELPEIKSPTTVNIVHVDGDTLFFASHMNVLSLYKIMDLSYTRLDLLEMKDRETIMDFSVRVDGKSIILVMVTRSLNNFCRIEPLELQVKKIPQLDLTEDADATMRCLTELESLVNGRMPSIEEAHKRWPTLLSFSENIVLTTPIAFDNLIMDNGSILNMNVVTQEVILTPTEIDNGLDIAGREAASLILSSDKILQLNRPNKLTGNVVIEGDADFDGLHIDSLHANILNEREVELGDVISYTKDQQFSQPLRTDLLTVNDLEVDSLCGIPFEHWKIQDDPLKTTLDLTADNVEILNDTLIFVRSDIFVQDLRVVKLNQLDLQTFFDDLFIIGSNQIMRGNIYYRGMLQVSNLTLQSLNGVPSNELMTKTTEQVLGNVFIKNLEVDNLIVDSINGVSVDEAARISKENVIQGEVTIANLHITDHLVFEGDTKLSQIHPVQMYDDVKIMGDLTLKDLNIDPGESFVLNGFKLDIDSLFKYFWTKSTDQVIPNDITLDNGMTIDDLNTEFLNGIRLADYLYTTVTDIPKRFGKIHFENLEAGGSIVIEGKEPNKSVVTEDSLIINEKLQIEYIAVGNIITDSYNKIPIADIMDGGFGSKVPGTTKFEALQINERIVANDVSVKFLNEQNVSKFFEQVLYIDEDYVINNLRTPTFEVINFEVDVINGLKMVDFLQMLKIQDIPAMANLTIVGDLAVKGNMEINFINEMETMDYFGNLSEGDIIFKSDRMNFDNLTVLGNLTVNLLQGMKIQDLAANTLSKSRPQFIPGQFSFYKVEAGNLTANFVNGLDLTKLIFVHDALLFEGDVAFSDLLVKGNVATGFLNGYDVAELYENALMIPTTHVANLTIDGSVFWEIPVPGLESLSYLFDNAVTKNTNQIISGETIFENNVVAYYVTAAHNINGIDIPQIVADAVIPSGEPIVIKGRKTFNHSLTVDDLEVSGDINIQWVNGWDIVSLNSSIVRKFNDETVSGQTIFINNVLVHKLFVNGNVHGLPLRGIVTTYDVLPDTMYFKHLEVKNSINTIALDGIDFNDFVENRVTLGGDHEVYGDLQFNGQVTVSGYAAVSSINGISPSDLVLSESSQIQILSGEKMFSQDLIVDGGVSVPLINNVDVTYQYNNGILNDEDIDIYGTIIFETDVETQSNVAVSGLVNSIDLNHISDGILTQRNAAFELLAQNRMAIEGIISRSSNASQFLSDIFFYFEPEKRLMIRAPNIRKVVPVNIESMTRLNLYGNDLGKYCGLPDTCPCPTQYVAEIIGNDCQIWRMNGTEIIYNFHEPNGVIGINVVTTAVSSSAQCTGGNPLAEFTSISWMTPTYAIGDNLAGNVRPEPFKITGFVSDVAAFTHNGKVYIILAIYYDSLQGSHNVNSLVYELDPLNERMTLIQMIPTNGAWSLHVFEVPSRGPHLIIGCVRHPTESQLHRFNVNTSKYELLRTFPTGGSQSVKSLTQGSESFVLFDDSITNSVHIFNYKIEFDNFYFYQSLFHESPVNGIEVFYAGEFGYSDAYVIVTTQESRFFIYEYMFLGGFQLKINQWLDGVQTMVPFYFSQRRYIFAGTSTNSTIFRIVQQGPH